MSALDDKLARAIDRVFRLLGLRYAWTDVAAARYTLEHGDARSRAGAIEYLDNLLGGEVRRRVLPMIETAPMAEKVRLANSLLKSRPRDVVDTLAQLVHDEDAVVAGAALQFVAERDLAMPLHSDLEFLRARSGDPLLREAAGWLLDRSAGRREDPSALPIVELANRLRAVPLFAFVSVDELFRLALAARPVRRERDAVLHECGAPAGEVLFLLQGAVRMSGGDAAPALVPAPAALGLAEVLDGRAHARTATTVEPVAGVAVAATIFLTLAADNVAMMQGLFRMLLGSVPGRDWAAVYRPSEAAAPASAGPAAVEPIEIARLFRRTPLFGHATAEQLKDLVLATREVPLVPGDTLWDDRRAPAVYHVLAGEVRLEGDAQPALPAGVGSTVGVAETLAGESPGRRAVVARGGRALRLDQDELFDVLADHGDLLQGVFRGVIAGGGAP